MRWALRPKMVVRVTAAGLTRAVPEFNLVNRAALALAFAMHVRYLWVQETKHEEETRVLGLGDSRLGGDGDRDNRRGKAPFVVVSLLLGLLPEWFRLILWRALNTSMKESE